MRKQIIIICLLILGILGIGTYAFFNEGTTTHKEKTKKNLISVGFAQVGAESDWRSANSLSIKNSLTERKGFDLIFEDARQMKQNQILSLRGFIQQNVDYIVFSPVVEDDYESVLTEAKRANIPVIIIDRKVADASDGLYTSWIGSDFRLQGEKACACLKQYIDNRKMKDVNIVNIQGTKGSTSQRGRSDALEKACKANGWNLVARETGEYTQTKSKEVMKEILKKTKDIDFVYCENDNEAFGVIEALKEAGLRVGLGGDVQIISFDATKGGLKKTFEGEILIDIECNPLQGPKVKEVIDLLEKGGTPEKEYYIDEQVFVHEGIFDDIIVDGKVIPVIDVSTETYEKRKY